MQGSRLTRIEDRLDRLDGRVAKIEAGVAVLKWMIGFTLAVEMAILLFIWQIILRLPG